MAESYILDMQLNQYEHHNPPGGRYILIFPGDGMKFFSGFSAFIRHSIAHPVKVTSCCFNCNFSPEATLICSLIKIYSSDHFSNRMLHLNPRIHFHEIKFRLR